MAQDVGCGHIVVLFSSGLVPSLHVLVFGKKTFCVLFWLFFVCGISVTASQVERG